MPEAQPDTSQTTSAKLKAAFDHEPTKKFELAAKHYYDLFAYHAAQRLTAFNFFIVSLSFLSTAYATLFMKGADGNSRFAMAAVLAIIAYILVLAFGRLDKRNEQIINANERPLLRIQAVFQETFGESEDEYLWETFKATNKAFLLRTFGDLLPSIYIVAALLTSAGASYGFKEAQLLSECHAFIMFAGMWAGGFIAILVKGIAKKPRDKL